MERRKGERGLTENNFPNSMESARRKDEWVWRVGGERCGCCCHWSGPEEQAHDEGLSSVRSGPRRSMAKQTVGTPFYEGLLEQPDFGDGRRDCFQDIRCISK